MSKVTKSNNQRAFIGGAWSNSGEDEEVKGKDETCLVAQASNEICLGINLEPGEWIKDSGCSKHMMGNRNIFSTYKSYNERNVIFKSNLRGNIIGKVKESLNVTFDETLPPPKTSPLEDDDLGKEKAIKVSKTRPLGNDLEDKSLENNEIINIKESKSHPLENVIDTVMSDSKDSTVTYTAVSSPFKDGSDIGSPGVDGPPIMPEDPYAYIMVAYQVPPSPGPKEPQLSPPLDFVPEPMYPEYMPQEDEILPAEEQPLPAVASPTADSPGYIIESDLDEEPEEDDEDSEEDPADYPADKDDDDEEEEEPSKDNADDEDEDEDEDEEEGEEHPAPVDFVPPVHHPSPPLPASPPASVLPASPPASPIRPLGYQAAMIRLRAETPSTSHPLPLPTSSPPLQLLSSYRRTNRPEITLPPRKRLGVDLGPRYEIGEGSSAAAARPTGGRKADYGFVDTMDTDIR
ncbi:hypothetical protein Tco_0161562 [Tanacetum coccineum]